MTELLVSRIGTLVWRINPPSVSSEVDKRARQDGFLAKDECHITLIGSAASAAIIDIDALRRVVEEIAPQHKQRDYVLDDKLYLVDCPKVYEGKTYSRQSLIALARAPWVDAFLDDLSRCIDQPLPSPFPHVTLYTKGDKLLPWRGIGIDNQAEMTRYSRGIYAEDWKA